MNRYASRKFIAALATLATTQWSLYERLINGDQYVKVVIAVMVAYVAANVVQKATDKTKAEVTQ